MGVCVLIRELFFQNSLKKSIVNFNGWYVVATKLLLWENDAAWFFAIQFSKLIFLSQNINIYNIEQYYRAKTRNIIISRYVHCKSKEENK